jgi:hypothetical protein
LPTSHQAKRALYDAAEMRSLVKSFWLWALLPVLVVTASYAPGATATTTVVSQPATTRAVVDLRTPKAAAQSLLALIAAEDVAAVRTILDGEESMGELKNVLAELLVASGRMASASTKRFGRTGDPIGRPMLTVNDPAKIEEAQVIEDGDQATLQIAGHRRPMMFRRREGKWKLAPDVIEVAQDQARPQQIKLLSNMAVAMNELAREINSGKYQSSAEAERYVQEKLHAVMIETFKPTRTPTTTRATTQP